MHTDSIRALISTLFVVSFPLAPLAQLGNAGCTAPGRCLVGSSGCACDAQGECSEADLVCENHRCVACTPGTLGCPCDGGSSCDGGSVCLDDECVAAIEALCSDACEYAHDGECDDDGPNSTTSACAYGSDCSDCGARANDCAHDADHPQPCHLSRTEDGCFSSTIDCTTAALCGTDWLVCSSDQIVDCGTPTQGDETCRARLCTNSCSDAFDAFCDDGGPLADTDVCALGTDCADCGSRDPISVCSDSCDYPADGECDDGGAGAATYVCVFGTDCTDCGYSTSSATACVDTCPYHDAVCDDGGSGASTLACYFGTDCTDCGTRSP